MAEQPEEFPDYYRENTPPLTLPLSPLWGERG